MDKADDHLIKGKQISIHNQHGSQIIQSQWETLLHMQQKCQLLKPHCKWHC